MARSKRRGAGPKQRGADELDVGRVFLEAEHAARAVSVGFSALVGLLELVDAAQELVEPMRGLPDSEERARQLGEGLSTAKRFAQELLSRSCGHVLHGVSRKARTFDARRESIESIAFLRECARHGLRPSERRQLLQAFDSSLQQLPGSPVSSDGYDLNARRRDAADERVRVESRKFEELGPAPDWQAWDEMEALASEVAQLGRVQRTRRLTPQERRRLVEIAGDEVNRDAADREARSEERRKAWAALEAALV